MHPRACIYTFYTIHWWTGVGTEKAKKRREGKKKKEKVWSSKFIFIIASMKRS